MCTALAAYYRSIKILITDKKVITFQLIDEAFKNYTHRV